MKKQLSLVTLGMSAMLFMPVISQAKLEDSSEAVINVTGSSSNELSLKEVPKIEFNTVESSDGLTTADGKMPGQLHVLNTKEDHYWEVTMKVTDFKSDRGMISANTLKFEPGESNSSSQISDLSSVLRPLNWEATGGRVLFKSIGTSNSPKYAAGDFYQTYKNPKITIQPWTPSGKYTSTLTWNLSR